MLSSIEERWLKRAEKLFKDKPDSLIVYVVDDVATVCKQGVSSSDFSQGIANELSPTNMLTDVHDDMGNGNHE